VIGIDVHHCEKLKVAVKYLSSENSSFAILKLRPEGKDSIAMYFENLENVVEFACDIIHLAKDVIEEIAKDTP